MSKFAISIVFVICTAVASAAVADTNVVAKVEKRQQTVVANVGAVSSAGVTTIDTVIKAELKDAARDAKAEYKDRYEELKGVHDRFMNQLSNSLWVISALVTLLGVVVPIVGMVLERRSTKAVVAREILRYHNALEDVRKTSMDLKKSQAKSSMNLMKFVWVEFLHVITVGGYNNCDRDRDIAQPIYRIVEALTFTYKLGDDQVLKECVADVAEIVGRYQEVVKDKKDLDNIFKGFIANHGICIGSFDAHDLIKTIGKTPTLVTVLKFLNEFGIKMFGEVDG